MQTYVQRVSYLYRGLIRHPVKRTGQELSALHPFSALNETQVLGCDVTKPLVGLSMNYSANKLDL